MARLLDFLDGVTTPTEPTQGKVIANQLIVFPNDAAYEAATSGAPEKGNIYFNSTVNFIREYNGTAWTSQIDDFSAQTIGGVKTFSSDVIIQGDLTTSGTITKINSTDLEIVDKNIILNKSGNDASSEGAGWTIERTGNNGSFVYENALTTKFKLGDVGSEIEVMDISSGQTVTNKTISGASNTITNVSLTTGVTGILPIANGGTNASAKQAAFNNLAPTAATKGDILVWNGTNWVFLAKDDDAKVLTLDSGQSTGLIWTTPAVAASGINPNIFLNGDMGRWEREITFVNPSQNAFSADRWKLFKSLATAVFDIKRSTDVPTASESGFGSLYSLQVDVTTAQVTPGVSEWNAIYQPIQGFNFQPIFGQDLHAGFWVKSPKTGTFSMWFGNAGSTRSIIKTYVVDSVNTWEEKSITLTHDETGAWNLDNTAGLFCYFTLASGTSMHGTADSWIGTAFKVSTAAQPNVFDNTANNWFVTQVKLERGTTPTGFRLASDSISDERSILSSYYNNSYPLGIFPGANEANIAHKHVHSNTVASGAVFTSHEYVEEMRDSPTLTIYSKTGTTATVSDTAGNNLGANSGTVFQGNAKHHTLHNNSGGVLNTTNNAIAYHFEAEAEL